MKAVELAASGLEMKAKAVPEPKPTELLVRVRSAALNRSDLGIAAGEIHGAAGGVGTVLGIEWAGEVFKVGSDVHDFSPGDRVMCSGRGGYAEYAVADAGRSCGIPDDMSFDTAATLPVALMTMHDAVVTNGLLKRDETILVQGASSAVGLMALQIARLRGASVICGTSTKAGRRDRLAEFGATHVVDTSDPGWPEEALQATGGRGFDVIIDMISAGVANGNMRAAAVLARIVNVGRLGGQIGEFDFNLHALKRISYLGVTFRSRSVDEVHAIMRRMRADLWDAVQRQELRMPIDKVFALDEFEVAVQRMRTNTHFGKILLNP